MKSFVKRELHRRQKQSTSQRSVRRLARRGRGLRFEWLEQRMLLASDITILDSGVGTLDGFLGAADGTITPADGGATPGTLSRAALQGVGAGVNIDIAAGTSIAFNNLTSPLTLQTGAGNTATFTATAGSVTFASASSPLATSGGGLALVATTGIGTLAIPIETSVGNLEARTGTGGIFIDNVGALSIGGVLATLNGLEVQTSGDIVVVNNGSITLADNDGIQSVTGGGTSGNVSLTANGATADITSTVDKDSISAPGGSIVLVAGRDISLGTGGANFDNDVRASGAVTFMAGRDILLDGFADIASDDFGNATGGFATLTAGRNISLLDVTGTDASVGAGGSGGADVVLTTGADGLLTINANFEATVFSNSGDVTVNADRVAIASDSGITADNGGVIIRPMTAGRLIDLGSATDVAANTLELSDAELDRIFTPLLRIGSAASGNLNVTTNISPANVMTLSLLSGGTIADIGNPAITVTNLALDAGVAINLQQMSSLVGTLAARVTGSGGFLAFDAMTLSAVGTVDGIDGLTTNNGGISVRNSTGALTILNTPAATDVNSNGGNITFVVPGAAFTNSAGAAIGSNGGEITFLVTNIDLQPGSTINSGPGRTEIRGGFSLSTIDLGGSDAVSTTGLTIAEINTITAGILQFGEIGNNTGIIIVSAAIAPAGTSTLVLRASGNISQNAGATITETNLAIRNDAASVTLNEANDVSLLAANLSDAGDSFAFTDANGLTVGTVDGIVGITTNNGPIAVNTTSGSLTINQNVSSGTAAANLTAGEVADAPTFANDLIVSPGVSVSGGNLTLQAGDQILLNGGSTVLATGTITLNIGIGDLDNSGGATIQGTVNSGSGIPAVVGGGQVDTVLVDFTGGANLPDDLDVQGSGGTDSLTVSDAGGAVAHAYDIGSAGVTRDVVTISTTGVENVAVNGGDASDTFSVTPAVTTTISIDGNNPTPPASPGDSLSVDTTGTTNPMLTSTSTPSGLQGSFTFGNRQPVNFQEIESLNVADLAVAKDDSPDPVLAGTNLTYTITVTNVGTVAAQNVALTDVIPSDTTFVAFTAPAGWSTFTPPVGDVGTVTATNPSIAAGAVATFEIVVNVDSSASGVISNTVTVATTSLDANLANNTSTETTSVESLGLPECEVITLNSPGSPGTATIEDDADNPGNGVLIVTGTSGNDVIVIEPRPRNTAQLRVTRNGQLVGLFTRSDVQHIVAFGLAGNDKIVVNGSLSVPATLFGDEGNDQLFAARGADGLDGGTGNDRLFGGSNNDTLCGGDGNDFVYGQAGNDFAGGDAGNDKVYGEAGNDFLLGNEGNDNLYGGTGNDRAYGQAGNDQVFGEAGNDIGVGGDGNDKLYGGSGRDVLIGSDGLDTLFGDGHDDILVAGPTAHDEDDEALQAILAEWTSANSYTTRVNNIRNGGGANGAFVLDDTTVTDDGLVDTLWGAGGLDWFLFGTGDKLKDKASSELVN